MKSKLLHIIYIGFLSLLVASCSGNDELETIEEATNIQVRFVLVVGNESASRATYGKVDGNAYENFIDTDNRDFRFLFYNANTNAYIEEMRNVSCTPIEGSNYKTYTIQGVFTKIDANLKLVVLANWKQYPAGSERATLNDLCQSNQGRFLFETNFSPSSTNRIPMYGVKNIPQLSPNQVNDLGNIYMMRSLAKVKVQLDPELVNKGYTLNGVMLNKYNSYGMSAPKSMFDEFTNETEAGNENINIPTSINVGTSFSLQSTILNEFFTYIPEFDNINTDDNTEVKMTVSISGTGISGNVGGDIKFKLYDSEGKPNGEKLNILRNTYYVFTVKGLPEDIMGGNLKVDVSTYLGWDEVTLDPSYE